MHKLLKKGYTWILTGCLLIAAFQYRSDRLQQDVADKVLRFHVLANSDSENDQQLKLKVRDEIGTYLQTKLEDVSSLEETKAIIKQEQKEIVKRAENIVNKEGYSYPVKVSLEQTDFPVKTYGNVSFPEGSYQALRVTIGEGKGHNWWCVMYPNMCFSNSMYCINDEETKEKLGEVLTENELAELMAEGKIEIKCKYFEDLLKIQFPF